MTRPITKPDQTKAMQDMRRKVIALLMAYDPMRFGLWNPTTMRYTPNMPPIYDWINQYGHMKPKWLNKYSYTELVTLVSQITKITKPK